MRGILIDPFREEIEHYDYDGKTLISNIIKAHVTVIAIGPTDVLFCDDEALFRGHTQYFEIQGYRHPLTGRALLLGRQADKETDTSFTLEGVRRNVRFCRKRFVKMNVMEGTSFRFGKRMSMIEQEPIFEDIH